MTFALDYETGRPPSHRGRYREFIVLAIVMAVTSTPYALALYYQPLIAGAAILALAMMLTVAPFLQSASRGVAHAARFQLAGSNPFAMTGAMAILLGGVDALFDAWEDSASRRRNPWGYWTLTAVKLAVGPLGLVLVLAEFGWDLLQGRGLRLMGLKLEEFFRVAQHHDQICPEKSNDIFYADLALARLKRDPALYQWLRLRAMVFELQHYRGDLERGDGVPATNLFLQSIAKASVVIASLQWETLELAIGAYYQQHPERFPLRPRLAERLVHTARPLHFFLEWADDTTLRTPTPEDERLWHALVDHDLHPTISPIQPSLLWCALRLAKAGVSELTNGAVSNYIDDERLAQLARIGALHITQGEIGEPNAVYRWRSSARQSVEAVLAQLEPLCG